MSTIKGIGRTEFDGEGRVVATEYKGFWLVNAYVPNSGAELGRLSERTTGWDPAFGAFCKVGLAWHHADKIDEGRNDIGQVDEDAHSPLKHFRRGAEPGILIHHACAVCAL